MPSSEFLAKHGLMIAEYWILYYVSFEERPACDLVDHTRGFVHHGLGHQVPPWQEFELAMESLLKKGYIQVIDQEAIAAIQAELDADPALGPTSGLPEVGNVDFTRKGAGFLRSFPPNKSSGICYWYYAPNRCRLFCDSEDALVDHVTSFFDRRSVSDPVEVGPWRSRWWEKFDAGFYVEVEYEESQEAPTHE